MISGYAKTEEIYRGRKRVICRGIREEDSCPVIFKSVLPHSVSPLDLGYLEHEYSVLKEIHIEGVVKAFALEKFDDSLVLVLEDIGGLPLKNIISAAPLDMISFLNIAIKLSGTLSALHVNGVIHKDLNPGNIVVNLDTQQVQIIDFSISSRIPREAQRISHPDYLEGTLAYMSPEQTGRMNRAVDSRTDFYSLGVTFFEMLTSHLPFEADDPLEMAHCHIAKTPTAPSVVRPDIPHAISDIVLKLLAKTAEDRYQSGAGLKADLENCLHQITTNGDITVFHLGRQDIPERFKISEKLIGREIELKNLMSAFERVSRGEIELLLVTGAAGIGKSSLIREVHKPIVRRKGYFVSGKYDQLNSNEPYSAIIQALQELIRQIMTESEESITRWNGQLLHALGDNAQVVVEVFPALERIVGNQPSVQSVGAVESKNRFKSVFEKLMSVFAAIEHPLTIFLDDLQWADSASLDLLQTFMVGANSNSLLLIGAYRDNEVSSHHPLSSCLQELSVQGVEFGRISLTALTVKHVNQLIADTLKCQRKHSLALARVVHQRTEGNPFFAKLLLESLYEKNLLHFDLKDGRWNWDIEQIKRLSPTENVIDVMIRKIGRLSMLAQESLKMAACIGNRFDAKTLATILRKTQAETLAQLFAGAADGLITKLEESYSFNHDRIQEAAYALIAEKDRSRVHLEIGRLLLQEISSDQLDDRIFEVVNHLNSGRDLITSDAEQSALSRLNLQAGQKAKSSNAYQVALAYFDAGISLLRRDAWDQTYELAYDLHAHGVECKFLCGHYDDAEAYFDILFEHARSNLDKAKVYAVQLAQYAAQNRWIEAANIAVESLEMIGFLAVDVDVESEIQSELKAIKGYLDGRSIDEFSDWPNMEDEGKLMALRLAVYATSSLYVVRPDYLLLVDLRATRMLFEYGYSPTSNLSVGECCSMLETEFEEHGLVKKLGALCVRLAEKANDAEFECKSLGTSAGLALWNEPSEVSEKLYRKAFHAGQHTGDLLHGGYACCMLLHANFATGNALDHLLDEISKYDVFLTATKNPGLEQVLILRQCIFALQGLTEHSISLDDENFKEAAILDKFVATSFKQATHWYYLRKMHLAFLHQDFEFALHCAAESKRYIGSAAGQFSVYEHFLYESLVLTALYAEAKPEIRKKYLQTVEKNLRQLNVWASNCSETFSHAHFLVSAEFSRVTGHDFRAAELYEQAIESAHSNGFVHNEALANELAFRFWSSKGNTRFARIYLTAARDCYRQWGAVTKVRDLEEKHPELAMQAPPTLTTLTSRTGAHESSSGTASESLDLKTIVKAAQVLSGEITLDKLLERLIRLIMENAGAERGFLVLVKNDELTIEAEGNVQNNDVRVLTSVPLTTERKLSVTIINYVRRTGESLIIRAVSEDDRFSNDPYIQNNNIQSVMCTPIVHQRKLIGILYLENNLIAGAFTPARAEFINTLSTQAAISIENARLYQDMKQEIGERKRAESALQKAHDELELRVKNRTFELTRASAAADHANRAKSDFLARMSHELRTPLNAILGYAQIMQRDGDLSKKQSGRIRTVEHSGEHLLYLIDDILDLSKIEAGKFELELSDFNLNAFLTNIVDTMSVRAEQKALSFDFEVLTDIPGYVTGDEIRLRQILLNLLGNAVKFTEQGSVALRIESVAGDQGCELHFQILDTGIGIADSDMDMIFRPFEQSRQKSHQEGTGLGLAISRTLVDLMGGEIQVTSELGKGSVFSFFVLLEETTRDSTIRHPVGRKIIGYQGERKTILIADDLKENALFLVSLLEPMGFELVLTQDGKQALAKAVELNPDLILMDMVMPIMNGVQTARKLRELSAFKGTPIIALSASVFEEDKREAKLAGCDDFITKPVRIDLLLDSLQKHLSLEWTFDSVAILPDRIRKDVDADEQTLKLPERRTIEQLAEYATLGDIQGILKQLESTEESSSEYSAFVRTVRRLAENYRMNEILGLLNSYLEE